MPAFRTLTAHRAAYSSLFVLLLGGLAACGFQPLALWPLTILAIAGLIDLAARCQSARQAFGIGWLFGFAHFIVGNYWIATAFTYQAEMPQWLGSVGVILLSSYLAIFPALATASAWLIATRVRAGGADQMRQPAAPIPGFAPAFIGCWIITEWIRGWAFTGFGWNPIGIALLGPYDAQGLALTSKWIGTYGLSGLLIAIAAALRHAVAQVLRSGGGLHKAAVLLGTVLIAVSLALFSSAPASYLHSEVGARPFTLVQPDLRQETLDRPSLYEVNYQKLARLSVPETSGQRRLVFWPESGLADYLRDGYPRRLYRQMNYGADPGAARTRIGKLIGPYSLLLTGAVDIVVQNGDDIAARNSVTAIDSRGHIIAGYSKAHLVPYGEYLPLRSLLEPIGLSRLVAGTLDFWPGPGPRTLDFGEWGEAGVQICYEIVFSGNVVDPRNRPEYIFNPSNDGWFGSWGPPQHLAQARMRAIEEGLPVLRSTTTGISAVIDADGIVRQHLPRHTAGRIDGLIPPPHEPTNFSRFGNSIPLTLAALILLLTVVALRRRNG